MHLDDGTLKVDMEKGQTLQNHKVRMIGYKHMLNRNQSKCLFLEKHKYF